ncbi:MAG: FIST N-terminal domain-containing protein [Polyangiaceae bacterium]
MAISALGDRTADVCFVFASPRHDLAKVIAVVQQQLPNVLIAAATSAGEITDRGLTRRGLALLLMSAPESRCLLTEARRLGKDAKQTLDDICATPGAQSAENRARGRRHAACVLLGDGLSPVFEQLVVQIRKHLPEDHVVVGAGAADEGNLVRTVVASGGGVAEGGVLAVHFWSPLPWGVGLAHGLASTSHRMTVTKATGNVVHQLDGRSAMEAYRSYAAEQGIDLESTPTGQFLVENELGVLLFDQIVRVRAGLRALDDGAVFFAGEVPEGAQVCIVRGNPDGILEAAREAAEQAKAGLGGKPAAGLLVFSCVCRGMTLGDQYEREVAVIRDVFPGVPFAGFSSYGEIARDPGRLDGYHNNTIVIVAIPAGS